MSDIKETRPGNTVARDGSIIKCARRMGDTYGKDNYSKGDPVYAPKKSSPARVKFKAKRLAARAK